MLVHELTFAGGSIEGAHKLLNVSDGVGVLATTVKGDEHITLSGGAECFDCGRSKSVDHDKKSDLTFDVF